MPTMPVPTAAGTLNGGSSLSVGVTITVVVGAGVASVMDELAAVEGAVEVDVLGVSVVEVETIVVDGSLLLEVVGEFVGEARVVVIVGSLFFGVVVVVVGGTVEKVEDVEGAVVVTPEFVVVGLRVVVDDEVGLDEGVVVVVFDGGTSEVEGVRLVVGQCSFGLRPAWQASCFACPGGSSGGTPHTDRLSVDMIANRTPA